MYFLFIRMLMDLYSAHTKSTSLSHPCSKIATCICNLPSRTLYAPVNDVCIRFLLNPAVTYTQNSFSVCLRCRAELSATADRYGYWSLWHSQYSVAVQVQVLYPLYMYTVLARDHRQLTTTSDRCLLRPLNHFSDGSSDA